MDKKNIMKKKTTKCFIYNKRFCYDKNNKNFKIF